jgi:hypothetical protein
VLKHPCVYRLDLAPSPKPDTRTPSDLLAGLGLRSPRPTARWSFCAASALRPTSGLRRRLLPRKALTPALANRYGCVTSEEE